MAPPKNISAIFVGGDLTGRTSRQSEEFLAEIRTARKLLGDDAEVYGFFDRPVAGYDVNAPLSFEDFARHLKKAIRDSKRSILHFIQFGHGGSGPTMAWPGHGIVGKELVDFFSFRRKKGAFTSIIMDGCMSGGFGTYFLEDPNFRPSFFFGASPPFAVTYGGVKVFFDATIANADLNHDGILTLRERAIYEMNHSHGPFAVMYSTAGSPDIDLQGNAASAPYFEKTVKAVGSHKAFTAILDSLRFGEQAVVLVKGRGSEDEAIEQWFRDQAKNGGGFYQFLVLDSNQASSDYFGIKPDETALFAVGPNLLRHGIRMATDRPIDEQMPPIIASQDPLRVIADWEEKYRRAMPVDEILTSLFEEKQYSPIAARDHALKLLEKGDAASVATGLKQILLVFNNQAYNRRFPEINGEMMAAVCDLSKRIVDGTAKDVTPELLGVALQILGLAHTTYAKRIRLGLLEYGALKYPETFARQALLDLGSRWGMQFFANLYSGHTADVLKALEMIRYSEIPLPQEEREYVVATLLQNCYVEVRRAAAALVRQWSLYDPRLIERLESEGDDVVMADIIAALGKHFDDHAEVRGAVAMILRKAERLGSAASARFVEKMEAFIAEGKAADERRRKERETIMDWRLAGGYLASAFLRSEPNFRGVKTGGVLFGEGGDAAKGLWLDDSAKNLLLAGFHARIIPAALHYQGGWYSLMASGGALFEWRKLGSDYLHRDDPPTLLKFQLIAGYGMSYTPAKDSQTVDHGPAISAGFYFRHVPDRDQEPILIGPELGCTRFWSGEYLCTAGIRTFFEVGPRALHH